MSSNEIGSVLRDARTSRDMSVSAVSDALTAQGFKASVKTIYSWENGNSQPTPDALLALCVLYGITDVLSVFGYKKEKPLPTKQEPHEKRDRENAELLDCFNDLSDVDRAMVLRVARHAAQVSSRSFGRAEPMTDDELIATSLVELGDSQSAHPEVGERQYT